MAGYVPNRQEYLRVVRRQGTGQVICNVLVNGVVWDKAPEFFQKIQAQCPNVNITQMRDVSLEKEKTERDAWGCVWRYPGSYLAGQVIEHPLADWSAWKSYQPPDPAEYTVWKAEAEKIRQAKSRGELAVGTTAHGFLYLQLTYLRGFENFMLDLAEDRKELYELRDVVVDFWLAVIQCWLEMGIDVLNSGDDLGHQNSLPISPDLWRKFLKPAFARVCQPCRQAGVEVYFHSDGWILDIIPDLLEIGVTILNPQDMVNGLDNLKQIVG
ncbi:MAG: hypothetical protein GWP14_02285 [Actinobacteria bacterium]|nr:hypothetical protein [Actinomycetota bacterium]